MKQEMHSDLNFVKICSAFVTKDGSVMYQMNQYDGFVLFEILKSVHLTNLIKRYRFKILQIYFSTKSTPDIRICLNIKYFFNSNGQHENVYFCHKEIDSVILKAHFWCMWMFRVPTFSKYHLLKMLSAGPVFDFFMIDLPVNVTEAPSFWLFYSILVMAMVLNCHSCDSGNQFHCYLQWLVVSVVLCLKDCKV